MAAIEDGEKPAEGGNAMLFGRRAAPGWEKRVRDVIINTVAPETLGSYEVKRLLGRGGMGEVYLARDPRLGRDVAVKVLPQELADHPGRRERFLREARAVAALNHPGIATIHEIGESDGRDFLAFEYVEGSGLDEVRAERKPSSAELIDWALTIAEALEFAHGKGIVHRDLKPANVMLSAIGSPKLLDFGLAKALYEPDGSDASLLTAEGQVLGTPAYMSPEQALGKEVDTRTDVFSFGSLLYQLASGTEPFGGDTALEVLDRVVHAEPRPLAQLRPDLPDGFLAVVEKSMRKKLEERYQHMSDAVADLRHVKRATETASVARATDAAPGRANRLPWVVAGLALVAAIVFFVWSPQGSGSIEPAPGFALDVPRRVTFEAGLETHPSISPDGTQVAYSSGAASRMRVYIRSVKGGRPRPLSEEANPYEIQPSYSPSGESILFLKRDGAYRAPALGGPAVPIARAVGDLPPMPGRPQESFTVSAAAWSPDGRQVFVAWVSGDLSIVTIDGGTTPLGETTEALHSCSWSPRGTWIACTSGNLEGTIPGATYGNIAPSAIVLLRASDGELRKVTDRVTANQSPVWSPDGRHLLFVSNRLGPYDVYMVEIADDGTVVDDPVRVTTGLHARSIALSAGGARLIYETYSAKANLWSLPIPSSAAPVDASDAEPLTTANQVIESVSVSRDGQFVVYDSNLPGNSDIYRIPVDGGAADRLTHHPADDFSGSLSPDGKELAYHSWRTGSRDVFVQPLQSGSLQQITDSPTHESYPSWSPVPGRLAFVDQTHENRETRGLFLVTRGADGTWAEPVRLRAGAGSHFDWFPEGDRIVYTRKRAIEVVSTESSEHHVIYEPTTPRDPPADAARISDDGRLIYFKSHDKAGRASVWSVPVEGGRPSLLVRFTDDEHPSTRPDFDVGAGRLFFTTEDRQSEVWVAEVVR